MPSWIRGTRQIFSFSPIVFIIRSLLLLLFSAQAVRLVVEAARSLALSGLPKLGWGFAITGALQLWHAAPTSLVETSRNRGVYSPLELK